MLKFRGCLAGGLVGDCLGSPFEGDIVVPKPALQKFIAKQLEEQTEKLPSFQVFSYTDDTAMTKSIAQSLIEMKKFDPKDMAKRFALEYNKEPKRGYGTNVVDVFAALMLANYEHPFEPAKRQFGGLGSYGNGGAMRCGPVALYGYSMEQNRLIELTRDCARITHSNLLGYNGAILQCLAINQALHIHSPLKGLIDINAFLNGLIEKMSKVETDSERNENNGSERIPTPFTDKLRKVKEILNNELKGTFYSVDKIVAILGNDISALKSVPTAIYAALRGQFPIDGFESNSPFVRTLFFAVSLGGDTDTIASMACSISGAIYGIDAIPRILLKHCESNDVMEKYADDLYRLVRCNN
ncbi:hypothetical protein RDWZM_000615 [Blomia tropicalis]|uniref:ADP-ribosylhydrolase ARH3 n=1 Tax=Blomia tropicalis TaxID=40697 RepID=A0A9Q0RPY6_BLOTA|nr:hypothetical protein RDWZM_000615 [Blomia tropicalis]